MSAPHILLLLALGLASAVLGYALAYALLAERLIGLFAGPGSGDRERGVIGDLIPHFFCVGPLLLGTGFAIAPLAVHLDRLAKVPASVSCLVTAALSRVAGFGAYFPLQVLLLVAAAF